MPLRIGISSVLFATAATLTWHHHYLEATIARQNNVLEMLAALLALDGSQKLISAERSTDTSVVTGVLDVFVGSLHGRHRKLPCMTACIFVATRTNSFRVLAQDSHGAFAENIEILRDSFASISAYGFEAVIYIPSVAATHGMLTTISYGGHTAVPSKTIV